MGIGSANQSAITSGRKPESAKERIFTYNVIINSHLDCANSQLMIGGGLCGLAQGFRPARTARLTSGLRGRWSFLQLRQNCIESEHHSAAALT